MNNTERYDWEKHAQKHAIVGQMKSNIHAKIAPGRGVYENGVEYFWKKQCRIITKSDRNKWACRSK